MNWWQRLCHRLREWINYLLSLFGFSSTQATRLRLLWLPDGEDFIITPEGIFYMQTLTKEGSKVALSAVDAVGLAATVPQPTDWTVTGDFSVVVGDDGLSAAVIPGGSTSTGTLVVKAGSLTVTEDLSFTSAAPEDHTAVKLNLVFTPIAPAAPAPVPAP